MRLRPQILEQLGPRTGLDYDALRSWLLFGLTLHDLGKFAECFQIKREAGPVFEHPTPFSPRRDPGHGSVGLALWDHDCDHAQVREDGGFRNLFAPASGAALRFQPWISAMFGHHGRPVDGNLNLSDLISKPSATDARTFVTAAASLFPVRLPTLPRERVGSFKETSWLVTGIAMIADWIGSNQIWFPYERPHIPFAEYWPVAQCRAADALVKAGLSRPRPTNRFNLQDALACADGDADPAPSDLQAWATSEFEPGAQTLVVIEDLTGAGKTEAALIAAHRLMRRGAAGGLYWALPTMATANGLYARLARSYDRLFADPTGASLVLAHGKRDFNETFKRSVLPAGAPEAPHGRTADDESASAQCAAWLADDRRKAFLADVGVGTIDQALLGVLPAKHQAMRLAALSQRVLVIDEVHAYDPYVSRLINTLLRFHAALGGSAILLTATLTLRLRAELVASFAKGARWAAPKLDSSHFPLVTVVTGEDGARELPREPGRGTRRDLAVARIGSEGEAIELLAAAHARGQACVWVRNTVHDAVAAAGLLRARLGQEAVDLFHARFALGDRIDIETRTLERFGRFNTKRRHCVLVATQVVEQSLDLDFDVMVSDLAPIDLLIQRAGRLHRHQREARPDPVLHILAPDPSADTPATWFADMFPKGQYVYAHHGQLWLTMRHLLDQGGLMLASQSPRHPIETVFAEDAVLPPGLHARSSRAEGEAHGQRGVAALNALDLSQGYAAASGTWASDQVTPTRLGAPQRLLRLAKWDGASLQPWYYHDDPTRAWRLSEVQVLAARVESVVIEETSLKAACDRAIADWADRFDLPLLVPLSLMDGEWRCCDVIGTSPRDGLGPRTTLRYSSDLGLRF